MEENTIKAQEAIEGTRKAGKREEAEKKRAGREQPNRKDRIPFGQPGPRLPRGEDPANFHYRLFNSGWLREPNRILRAKQAGYEVVEDYGDLSVGVNEDGSAIKGVLMRIPKDLYEADQKLKQEENDKVDKEIKAGKFQEKPQDRRYVPRNGIHFETKDTP
jgi:hypothetical protein